MTEQGGCAPTIREGLCFRGPLSPLRSVWPLLLSRTLRRLQLQRDLQSIDDAWSIEVAEIPGGRVLDECLLTGSNEPQCPDGAPSGLDTTLTAGTTALSIRLRCLQSGCGYVPSGPLYDFAIAIYSSEVTIEESVAPTVGVPSVLGGGSAGWSGGEARLQLSGADTLGIRRFEVLEGDTIVGTVQRSCVDWSVLPCSEPAAGLSTTAAAQVKLSELAIEQNEEHQLRVRAVDAAGNSTTSAPITVGYDTSPRTPMSFLGTGLSNEPTRTLAWFLSGRGAPAVSGTARICTTAGPGTGEWP